MHDKSSVDFHREVIDLRRRESKLKKLLSIPRRKLEQEELVESLRDVWRGRSPRVRVTREVLTSGHTAMGDNADVTAADGISNAGALLKLATAAREQEMVPSLSPSP